MKKILTEKQNTKQNMKTIFSGEYFWNKIYNKYRLI
jgi:hypothetical protein